jgi:hypothetical protein
LAVHIENAGGAVKHGHAARRERLAEGRPAHGSAVVVPEYSNDRQAHPAKELGGQLRLEKRAVVRDVACDYEQISPALEIGDMTNHAVRHCRPNM